MPISLIRLFILFILPLTINAYTFHASLDNKEPLLGEEVTLTLTFSYDNIEEYEIEEPNFEHIKTKLMSEEEYQENNTTWIVKQRYSLMPQQTGKLEILPLNLHIESIAKAYQKLYNRNKYLEKVDIQTEKLLLNVLPLPQGVKINGDYKLIATVDKTEVNTGMPINFTLILTGEGNLDDIDFFILKIPHTTIYTKPSKHLSKSFTIISDTNYTIPSITLKYYNPKSRSLELTSSQAFSIKVATDAHDETADNYKLFYLPFILGFLLFFVYLYRFLSSKKPIDPQVHLIKTLKKIKSKETFLKKVVPYMDKSKSLKRLIYKLETSSHETFKSLKKEIIMQLNLHLKGK